MAARRACRGFDACAVHTLARVALVSHEHYKAGLALVN